MSYLLDTNVVSELRKPVRQMNPAVLQWASVQVPDTLFLSAVSVFELEIGVRRKERLDPRQGARLRSWLEHDVLDAFGGRLLPFDTVTARRAAEMHVPDPRPDRDTFIAATALVRGLVVATRNEPDFRPLGVKLVNPWTPEPE